MTLEEITGRYEFLILNCFIYIILKLTYSY